jgi:hypothetical protein
MAADLLLAASLAALLIAGSQTLGDAAGRAADQRRQPTSKAPRSFSADDLVTYEWTITRAGFEVYANARAEIGAVRRARPGLHAHLFDVSRDVTSLGELVPALEGQPLIVAALEKYGLTAGEFLRREQTILTASAWAERRPTAAVRKQSNLMANVDFIRKNRDFVRLQTMKYQRIEPSSVWWHPRRFVEEP